MCGSSNNPGAALRCVAIWCMVLGILGGVTSPSSICAIIVASVILCCSQSDTDLRSQGGCVRAGTITGIVLAVVDIVIFAIIGLSILGQYGTICSLASGSLDVVCPQNRRALDAMDVVVMPWMKPLPVLHWVQPSAPPPEHITFGVYNHSLASYPTLYALLPGAFGKTLPKLLASAEKPAFETPAMVEKDAAAVDFEWYGRALQSESGSGGINDDSCTTYASDGDCDDGGPGAEYNFCAPCTDLEDCGTRSSGCSTDRPPPPSPRPPGKGGGGGGGGGVCSVRSDGDCDDGGPGSEFNICDCGTDGDDCGPRTSSECRGKGGGGGGGSRRCPFTSDGECDDGGPGHITSICECGTDREDCGPRTPADCANVQSGGSGSFGAYTEEDCTAIRNEVEGTCGMYTMIGMMIIILPGLIELSKVIAFAFAICHINALDAQNRVSPAMGIAGHPVPAQQQFATGVPVSVPVATAVPVGGIQMQAHAVATPVPIQA